MLRSAGSVYPKNSDLVTTPFFMSIYHPDEWISGRFSATLVIYYLLRGLFLVTDYDSKSYHGMTKENGGSGAESVTFAVKTVRKNHRNVTLTHQEIRNRGANQSSFTYHDQQIGRAHV